MYHAQHQADREAEHFSMEMYKHMQLLFAREAALGAFSEKGISEGHSAVGAGTHGVTILAIFRSLNKMIFTRKNEIGSDK